MSPSTDEGRMTDLPTLHITAASAEIAEIKQ